MTESLKQRVFEANMALPAYGLVTFTWGNVSASDRHRGLVAIKPSGVEYDGMTVDDIVVVELESGRTIRAARANAARFVDRPVDWDDQVWLTFARDAGVVLTQ